MVVLCLAIGGRHLLGPTISFLQFPAYTVMLEFSDRGVADNIAPPVDARYAVHES